MLSKQTKNFAKTGLGLAAGGIALGVGSSLLSDSGADASILSPVSKGLGIGAGLAGVGFGLSAISDLNKSLKKKLR